MPTLLDYFTVSITKMVGFKKRAGTIFARIMAKLTVWNLWRSINGMGPYSREFKRRTRESLDVATKNEYYWGGPKVMERIRI
jgi:hypothetical protein